MAELWDLTSISEWIIDSTLVKSNLNDIFACAHSPCQRIEVKYVRWFLTCAAEMGSILIFILLQSIIWIVSKLPFKIKKKRETNVAVKIWVNCTRETRALKCAAVFFIKNQWNVICNFVYVERVTDSFYCILSQLFCTISILLSEWPWTHVIIIVIIHFFTTRFPMIIMQWNYSKFQLSCRW